MKERPEKAYSLHRYVDENGAPDRDVILSELEPGSKFKRHLNPNLMRILDNQPEEVKGVVDFHLSGCESCREKYGT